MQLFPFSSLRSRLILLILLAVLPSLGMTLYTGLEEHQIQMAQVQENTLRLTRLAAGDLVQVIEGARQLLIGLAQLPEVGRGDSEVCGTLFSNLLRQYPYYLNLGVIDSAGNLSCSALPFQGPVSMGSRVYVRGAINTASFTISPYQIEKITGEATINFVYPVLGGRDGGQSAVFAALDLKWFKQIELEAQLPKGAELIVVDHNGTILARYPEPNQWVGQFVPAELIVQAAISRHGEPSLVETRGVDGVRRLYGFSVVRGSPDSDIYVSIGITKEAAFGSVNRMFVRNMVGVGLVGVLALAAAWLGGNAFILRRVSRLVNATQKLASGDLSVRIGPPYEKKDELCVLGRSFDEMAESLEQRTSQLHQAEVRYRTLVEQIPMITYIAPLGRVGNPLYISPQVKTILGFSREEWLTDSFLWLKQLHPEDRERVLRDISNSAVNHRGGGFCLEYRIYSKEQRLLWVRDEAVVVQNEDGQPQFLQGILLDITGRKSSEEQLRRSHERLRDLAAHIEAAREDERTRIAREIHDELGQSLTGLKMDVAWVEKRLSASRDSGATPLLLDKIQSIKQIIAATIQCVRKITTELRPGILDDLGLLAAIEWQAMDFQNRMGISCEFLTLPESLEVDGKRSSSVFRIFQEILTNIARHANATRVFVCLKEEAGSLVLEVKDNGRGITEREVRGGKSFGILGMRERALLLGGEFDIRGAQGQGTTVRVRIPLEAPTDN